jgi:regulator of replication initiation timing
MYREYTTTNPDATKTEIFKSMESEFGVNGITVQARYYRILKMKSIMSTAKKVTNIKEVKYQEFLSNIISMQETYSEIIAENQRLRNQVEELENKLGDYEVLQKVMEEARQIVIKRELGEHEKPRFKMDQNGNLERIG